MSFVFADLFAGIGGFRIALESIGGECVFSSEWDKYAQSTYQANFGDIPNGDITQINPSSIPDIDILTAGFPCQPFSSIGKREGFEHPTQGTLFYDVVKILKEKKTKAFILENVEGLINHDGGKTLRIILDTLSVSINGQYLFLSQPDVRYHVFWSVLDSKDYGVPQVRKRIFIVGISEDISRDVPNFKFPTPIAQKEFIGSYVEENITGYSISKHLQDSYLFKLDDGKPELIDRDSKIQVKTLCSTYHKIQRLTGTFVKDGETGIRLLSENECKAIMGYPQSFIIPVSRTQMYRQFGNSVVVPVVRKVAINLVNCLGNHQTYLAHTGKIFRDPDRGIRSLYQKGFLQKISKGIYKYDPKYAQNKRQEDFTNAQKNEILKRDGYKCVICGASRENGVELHIDHIKPKDMGGLATVENGQTLCSQHNFLKKNLKQTETGKKMFIRLYELAKKENNQELQEFCVEILNTFEEFNINGHIEWKK